MLPSRRHSPGDTTDAGSSHDETRPLKVPRLDQIGSFSIEEKIGEGGMGVVYRARDPRLQRTVAIKRIHPRLQESVDIRERFLTEARAIAAVSHPNIGQIHAIHEDEDPPYLVMEFLEGPSFEIQVEKHGPLSSAETIRIAISAAHALRAAVRSGIIHRDVKPSNLLQDARGVVKLVDFGLAGNLGENPQDDPELLCTPQYGSPEQIQGWALDERSDIYSLGATMFHLLTGKPPFERESRVDLMVAQVNEPAKFPSSLRSDIHPELALLILRMLEKRPEDRPHDHGELLTELEQLQRKIAPPARTRLTVRQISLAVTLLLGAILLGTFWPEPRSETGIQVDGTLRGILSSAAPYELLSYDFDGGGDRIERFFRFPALPENAGGHVQIAPVVRDGTLLWANDPRAISFPYLKELRRWRIDGLRCLGTPDLELRTAQDPERPGDRLRIGLAVGRGVAPRIEVLQGGIPVPIEVEQQSQLTFIREGVDHSITLDRRPSEDPTRARYRLQISRQDGSTDLESANLNSANLDSANLNPTDLNPTGLISTVTFTLPVDAIPRGAPAIRCEGDLARWNTRIGRVQILGLLDRDRIMRSWILEGGP
ncbi:MAG: serine/threonine-protein kinase [Planctomycetota bacterium]|nr:serine/threonine-protein kinase [Planctomycetota bacterium]